MSCRIWRDVIAIDEIDLCYYGTEKAKLARHVGLVGKGMNALTGGHFVERDGVDVDIWRYHFRSERDYFANVDGIPEDTLEAGCWRYIVHEDALCFNMAIFPARFRFFTRDDSAFWSRQAW